MKYLNSKVLRGFCYSMVCLFALLLMSCTAQKNPVKNVKTDADGIDVTVPDYPRVVKTPEGKVTIHMPNINSWENYETLTAWVAIDVIPKNSEETWIGSINFKAKSDIDFKERLVVLYDIEIIDHKFHKDIKPP